MKQLLFFSLVLLLTACSSEDKSGEDGKTADATESPADKTDLFPASYAGDFGDDMGIAVELWRNDEGDVVGHYYYDHIGKEIDLKGQELEGGRWLLEEFVDGNYTGAFEVEMTSEHFTGTWGNGERTYDVQLGWLEPGLYVHGLQEIEEAAELPLNPHYSEHPLEACMGADGIKNLNFSDSSETDFGDYIPAISESDYNNLSVADKLIHCLEYPESFSQVCSPSPVPSNGKLLSSLPYSDEDWSGRQWDFLQDNKEAVLSLFEKCISETNYTDVDILITVSVLDGVRIWPTLKKAYLQNDDPDELILTVFHTKMTQNFPDYREWVQEAGLFEPAENDERDEWEIHMELEMNGIKLTPEIEAKILEYAMKFVIFYPTVKTEA